MKRRSVIKSLLMMSGGVLFIPSCIRTSEKHESIIFNNFTINSKQEDLMIEVSETILPATDTPGAKVLDLHLFVLKMLDDCYEMNDQLDFFEGLEKLETVAKVRYGSFFGSCVTADKESLLKSIEESENKKDTLFIFFKIMKERLIQGYLNSEYVMTNLLIYEFIPNSYNGYVPVKNF